MDIGRYLRIKEVVNEVGIKRATIYKRISEGTFPKQISLGGNIVVWSETEIRAWKEEKMANRDIKLCA